VIALAPVIGLEIHVQLKTHSKLFCGNSVVFDAEPNTHVCPVCLGLPGALPVPNRRAIELAVRAAAALGCHIQHISRFDRKSYFYPDLPKGYQITQYDVPLAAGGALTLRDGSVVRIRRAHVEEDAGKLLHERFADKTAIDMNRAGVPLLEIVTEPDIISPEHARAFLTELKRTLQYLDVSDCEMEKGSLRVDANVSVLAAGGDPATAPRTELKNMNSFAGIERALHAEIARQTSETAAGRRIEKQTLAWNDVTGTLSVLRLKEQGGEYRFMHEPDLPPLVLAAQFIDAATQDTPELPVVRAMRLEKQYGLRANEAGVLCTSRQLADYFESVAALTGDGHAAAAWTMREVLSATNTLHTEFPVSATRLAELINLVRDGRLSAPAARTVFRGMCERDENALHIAQTDGLLSVDDEAAVRGWLDEIMQTYPRELQRLRNGEARLFEFFVGELMKRAKGRLDPQRARAAIAHATQG
jgi:aspartyl-tRNA(Asn)/glutamyl-tRNA(Gln) amidotransferase subunit B